MKSSAMLDERGQRWRKQYGYIPYDKYTESVASDMEYAIADGALAAVALKLGHTDDYRYFTERSHSYRHYWDPSTGFMRGLSSEGEWHSPFDPFHSKHRDDDYTEGNAWQYTFLVPHDVDGLTTLMGKGLLIERLDSLFLAQGDLGKKPRQTSVASLGNTLTATSPGITFSTCTRSWDSHGRPPTASEKCSPRSIMLHPMGSAATKMWDRCLLGTSCRHWVFIRLSRLAGSMCSECHS